VSALSTEWAPGYSYPGARPFENMPADLALVGCQFAAEQIELMEKAARFRPGWWSKMYALAPYALPDPVFPHSEALGLLALTLDEEMNADPVFVPSVVEIDCSEWETFDESEPAWRRFPSVLGRRNVYSKHTGLLTSALAPIRLWDCWPLDDVDVGLVNLAMLEWIEREWDPYLKWLEVRDNADTSACDYEGTPPELHDHEYDPDGMMHSCLNGDHWFAYYQQTQMTCDPDGDPYPRPFKPVGGLDHLSGVWEHLLGSSRTNTMAALSGYPEWEQAEVARIERNYSPWLWSS
jgi:hypothetical protein